jgi:hypothetical protein
MTKELSFLELLELACKAKLESMDKPLPPPDLSIMISFKKFYEYKYPERERYNLYIVWRGKQALYVGISTNNVWNRWFGRLAPHIRRAGNKWLEDWSSPIGSVVTHNLPASLRWKIELRYYDRSLKTIESRLINDLRPLFNITYGPKLNKKELRLMDSLTAHKEYDLIKLPFE